VSSLTAAVSLFSEMKADDDDDAMQRVYFNYAPRSPPSAARFDDT